MKLCYTNNLLFTSYTTVIPHSDSWSNFSLMWCHAFSISMYKIIATCIECTTALRANNTHVKHGYKGRLSFHPISCGSYDRPAGRKVKLFCVGHLQKAGATCSPWQVSNDLLPEYTRDFLSCLVIFVWSSNFLEDCECGKKKREH